MTELPRNLHIPEPVMLLLQAEDRMGDHWSEASTYARLDTLLQMRGKNPPAKISGSQRLRNTRTFRGELISLAEAEALITAANTPFSESGSEVTLRVHGVDWTGKVQALDLQRELGLAYYSGTVTLWDATKVKAKFRDNCINSRAAWRFPCK